jgi:drug/metabolite transporter (DMT)-like permease
MALLTGSPGAKPLRQPTRRSFRSGRSFCICFHILLSRDALGVSAMTASRSSTLLAVLFVPLWSSGFITARLVAPYVEAMTFLTLRFALAGLVLAVAAIAFHAPWPKTFRSCLDAIVAGFLIHGIYLGCVFWGVAHGVPAGVSALIAGLQPILTGLAAGPLLKERVSMLRWSGITAGALGAALVIAPRLDGSDQAIPALPLLVSFIGTVAITAGTIWQKKRGSAADLRSGTALQYVGALVPVMLGAVLIGEWRLEPVFPVWVGLFWSIFGMSIGAITLLMILIRQGAVAQVASLLYLVPGVSAAMGYVLFHETMMPIQMAGLLIAAIGVAIASRG